MLFRFGGKSQSPYPWGGPYLRNRKGCLLANFKPGRGNYPEDGGFYTVRADAYWPNDFGLYNMAGNVSEMVVDRKGHFSVKGGNWNSSSEFLRIRDNDFTEFPLGIIPCPFIGFRPVININ